MNEKERRIYNYRLTEAQKKGYLGTSGKFGVIVRIFGQPIVSHSNQGMIESDEPTLAGIGFSSTAFTDDEYGDEYLGTWGEGFHVETSQAYDAMGNPIGEPTGMGWSERTGRRKEQYLREIGWHFDGLSRGMQLEIKLMAEEKELCVKYKGYVVYLEVGGELESYVPNDEWEAIVERLYKPAVNIIKQKENEAKSEQAVKNERAKANWIEEMRKRWGF